MTDISTPLLPWYRRHGRHDLPWQKRKTGYRVWVSEIMLQQTQVKTVIPYYQRFMKRFPSLAALAEAPQDDVLQHWAGLGYYARARNLHKAAQIIMNEHKGRFPQQVETLVTLPGIGDSTAAAIVSFAYGQPACILDGNVKRVLTRFYAISGDPNKAELKNELWEIARNNTPADNCHEYNQAIMDLGATCCTRTRPDCHRCPLHASCEAFQRGTPTAFPDKSAPIKQKTVQLQLLVLRCDDRIALIKRPSPGIWGGLWCLPDCSTADAITPWLKQHQLQVKHRKSLARFTHQLSHRLLEIEVELVDVKKMTAEFEWVALDEQERYGVPKPVQRVWRLLEQEYASV